MAVGSAVVLCDYAGVGPMVTSVEFEGLRRSNFGFETLREPLAPGPILREIARYDTVDAERVRDLTRATACVERTVEKLVTTYREVIAENGASPPARHRPDEWSRRESLRLRLYWAYTSIPRRLRERINGLPGLRRVIDGLRRLP